MNRFRALFLPTVLACLFGVASPVGVAAGVAYTLDPGHTQVEFNWNHLGFSNPGASFDEVGGRLIWDAADPSKSSVTVTIPVDSIDSHVPLLDQKLKSAEFFNAIEFPTITFVSTQVMRTDAPGMFKITGDLTVHGITKPVVLEAKLNKAGLYPMLEVPALGFDATTSFKRSEFGVGAGVPMVGDEIRVRITAEALETTSYGKAMERMKAMSEGKRQNESQK